MGFLGAGAIVKDSRGGEVQGLTTAAGIWLTAAIDIAAGMGREASAVPGAVLAFVILSAPGRINHWMRPAHDPPAPTKRLDEFSDALNSDLNH